MTHPRGRAPPGNSGSWSWDNRLHCSTRGMERVSRFRARPRRGATLLLALGVMTFLTLGAITTVNLITAQTDPAGQDRRAKEAFFAAEAGLAEAREWLRLQTAAIPSPQPTNAILAELAPAADLGGPTDPWYQVPLGNTPASWVGYRLSQSPDATGAQAIDPSVTTAGLELTGADGTQYQAYPDTARLVYRVFLRDDDDGDGDPTVDSNGTVWLVAVGQVQVGLGVPVQSVVRVLVRPGTGAVGTGYSYSDKIWDPVHLNENAPINANKTTGL
ncbi:MAG: PilX N-terminal domain-containing pilus assembly protein [Myxococcaceae bacterium]